MLLLFQELTFKHLQTSVSTKNQLCKINQTILFSGNCIILHRSGCFTLVSHFDGPGSIPEQYKWGGVFETVALWFSPIDDHSSSTTYSSIIYHRCVISPTSCHIIIITSIFRLWIHLWPDTSVDAKYRTQVTVALHFGNPVRCVCVWGGGGGKTKKGTHTWHDPAFKEAILDPQANRGSQRTIRFTYLI